MILLLYLSLEMWGRDRNETTKRDVSAGITNYSPAIWRPVQFAISLLDDIMSYSREMTSVSWSLESMNTALENEVCLALFAL